MCLGCPRQRFRAENAAIGHISHASTMKNSEGSKPLTFSGDLACFRFPTPLHILLLGSSLWTHNSMTGMLRQLAFVLDRLLWQQGLGKAGAWGTLVPAGSTTAHQELISPVVCPHYQPQSRGLKTQSSKPPVQVVLLQDVPGLGKKGQVVAANPGWVRLRLFPRGAALYATPENVQRFAQVEQADATKQGQSIDDVERQMVSMLRMLSHRIVDVSRKAAELDNPPGSSPDQGSQAAADTPPNQTSETMIGSVTSYDIQQCVLRQIGIQLHDSHLLMAEPITSFGTFKVPLNLRMLDDHQVELTVRVHKVRRLRHGRASVG